MLMDLQHRDITPEDYDLLLQLSSASPLRSEFDVTWLQAHVKVKLRAQPVDGATWRDRGERSLGYTR